MNDNSFEDDSLVLVNNRIKKLNAVIKNYSPADQKYVSELLISFRKTKPRPRGIKKQTDLHLPTTYEECCELEEDLLTAIEIVGDNDNNPWEN